ncbi:hypothetical protein Tco_1327978 [Tanacetum coccineum]
MPLVILAAGGSSSAAAAKVSALTEEGHEDVALEEAYLELADPDEGTTAVRQGEEEVVTEQPKKVKKRLLKQSDVLPAKKLRTDHPTLVSGTGGSGIFNDHHFNKYTANNLPLRGGHSIEDPSCDVLRLGALYSWEFLLKFHLHACDLGS